MRVINRFFRRRHSLYERRKREEINETMGKFFESFWIEFDMRLRPDPAHIAVKGAVKNFCKTS